MILIGDPVRSGLVASLARPGGNITGNAIVGPDTAGKRLQILKEVVPALARVAFLGNPDNASNLVYLQEAQGAARALGLQLLSVQARNFDELKSGFAKMMADRPDAFLMTGDATHQLHLSWIVDFMARNRLPAMYILKETVRTGGFISYGASQPDLLRRGARYVHKILQGANPGDLPVELPTKFELAVNLKTAKALGVTISPTVLARADEVIE